MEEPKIQNVKYRCELCGLITCSQMELFAHLKQHYERSPPDTILAIMKTSLDMLGPEKTDDSAELCAIDNKTDGLDQVFFPFGGFPQNNDDVRIIIPHHAAELKKIETTLEETINGSTNLQARQTPPYYSAQHSLVTEEFSDTEEGINYQCNDCHRVFNSCNALKYHYRSYTGQRSLQCDICGNSFFVHGALKSHTHTRTGKSYECQLCNRRFRQLSDLKYHGISKHSDEKKHQCEFWDQDSSSSSTNLFDKDSTDTHKFNPRYKNNTSSKSNYNKNITSRRPQLPLSERKSPTENKPYFCEEIRERDRLRRLYGKAEDKSPTLPKLCRPHNRSKSRVDHRQPSPYHHERFRGRCPRSSYRTRNRYNVGSRKKDDRKYDRSNEKYHISSREREYKHYRGKKEHRSSRERHHRLNTERYHRSSIECYKKRSKDRSDSTSRERKHYRMATKTENITSVVVPLPVMSDFSMPLWSAVKLPDSYTSYTYDASTTTSVQWRNSTSGVFLESPYMPHRHMKYPSLKYFVRGKTHS